MANRTWPMNFEAGNGNWWRPCNHEKTLQFSRTYFSLTMLKYFPFLRSQIKQMIEGLYFSKNTGVHYLILDSVFPFSKEISYIWMFSPIACFVTTWLSVDTIHSVVFILCKFRPGNPGTPLSILGTIPYPVIEYHKYFNYSHTNSSSTSGWTSFLPNTTLPSVNTIAWNITQGCG